MLGWMAQWYANVPAFANVCLKVDPLEIALLSKDPSSAVTVWDGESLFVHVTVEPTVTVIEVGPNEKFWIVTSLPEVVPPLEPAGA